VIGAAVALALNSVIPSTGHPSGEAAIAIGVKGILAGAAFAVAARLIARPELDEGARAIRAIFGRRRAA
jgi:hypothetical protein